VIAIVAETGRGCPSAKLIERPVNPAIKIFETVIV